MADPGCMGSKIPDLLESLDERTDDGIRGRLRYIDGPE
jgi:hypothetical protein